MTKSAVYFFLIKVFAIFALFGQSIVFAQSWSPPSVCKELQVLAYKVMEARQEGVPIEKMLSIIDKNEIIETIVLSAYQQPTFSSYRMREAISNQFADRVYIDCYRAIR